MFFSLFLSFLLSPFIYTIYTFYTFLYNAVGQAPYGVFNALIFLVFPAIQHLPFIHLYMYIQNLNNFNANRKALLKSDKIWFNKYINLFIPTPTLYMKINIIFLGFSVNPQKRTFA